MLHENVTVLRRSGYIVLISVRDSWARGGFVWEELIFLIVHDNCGIVFVGEAG